MSNPKTGIYKQCDFCNNEIYVPKWKLENRKNHFCSKECHYNFTKGQEREPLSEETKIKIGNSQRGKIASDETRKKLSEACKGRDFSYLHTKENIAKRVNIQKERGCFKGENNPNYKGGISKVTFNCEECGELTIGDAYNYQNSKHHFCSTSCSREFYKENFIGENNPNWRGGITFGEYGIEFNKKLKLLIKERDNFTCQLCEIDECECVQNLQIHHIDYDKQNNKEENLVTLCSKCHGQTNFNRDDWTNMLKEMNDYE